MMYSDYVYVHVQQPACGVGRKDHLEDYSTGVADGLDHGALFRTKVCIQDMLLPSLPSDKI